MMSNDQLDLETLTNHYNTAYAAYAKAHKRMKLLDAVDSGEMWKSLGAKFPKYQILPDTNHVAYVHSNLAASIYTVEKSAQVEPRCEEDKDIIVLLNVALDNIWNRAKVGQYQFKAGSNAALFNIGITQVGWNSKKNCIALENISPIKFMRDPSAKDFDHAAYCMRYDKFHKSIILANPNYKEKFKEYLKAKAYATPKAIPELGDKVNKEQKDYYTIYTIWERRDDGSIDEIHVVNMEEILYYKSDIYPKRFPISILYCNDPGEKIVGISECQKILANSIAYNMMDSIALTSEYKNQRPPKFLSSSSGLNIQSFAKHGDEADRTFLVNGDPKQAVYFHQFPQPSSTLPTTQMRLQTAIQDITGIDGRYTGRDTGSVITTGGVEEMLNRVTVVDTPKILNYEAYAKDLTELILMNYLEYAPKTKYLKRAQDQANRWVTYEVDFPNIKGKETVFDYEIDISSELPANKQRIAQTANTLLEKQMQYNKEGGGVEIITPEEWLMMQDLPNKEYMLERMGVQRLNDAVEQTSQVLYQYSDLVKQGMNPNDALLATAEGLKQTQMGQMQAPQGTDAMAMQQEIG